MRSKKGMSRFSRHVFIASYSLSSPRSSPSTASPSAKSTLTVAPAANTVITYPNRSTPLVIDIDRDARGEEMCYFDLLHASTLDSGLPRDVPETRRIERSGKLLVRTGSTQKVGQCFYTF